MVSNAKPASPYFSEGVVKQKLRNPNWQDDKKFKKKEVYADGTVNWA